MRLDIHIVTAVGLWLLYLVPPLIAIALCVLLHRRSGNVGWLFLGMLFLEPPYRVAFRLVKGLSWYHTSSSMSSDGVQIETIRYDIPMIQTMLYVFAAAGIVLLYRRARHEKLLSWHRVGPI